MKQDKKQSYPPGLESNLFYNGNFVRFARQNMSILIFLGGIIFTWATMHADIKEIQGRIDGVENRALVNTENAATIRNDIVEIKTTLQFIKEAVGSKSNL